MDALYSIIFLCACSVSGYLITRYTAHHQTAYNAFPKFLVGLVFFLTFFFGSHLFLGYISFFTAVPLVNPFAEMVVALAILVILVGGGLRGVSRRANTSQISDAVLESGGQQGVRTSETPLARWLAILAIVLFAFMVLMVLAEGFPRGYESSSYHLPIALNIIQTHSLNLWDHHPIHAYPANASILYAYLMTFLPERFVSLGSYIFLPVLVLTIYQIAHKAGADPSASLLVSLGILTIPIIVLPAFSANADIGGLALIAVAIYFVMDANLPPLRFAVAGLAMGLALGFKSQNLIVTVFLPLAIVWQAWTMVLVEQRWVRLRAVMYHGSLYGGCALVMASFWLVRSYVEFHNPLYPVYIAPIFDVLGWSPASFGAEHLATIETQYFWVRSSWEWLIYPWVEWHYAGQYYNDNAGLGSFFAATVPVAFVYALYNMFKGVTGSGNKSWAQARFILIAGGICVLGVWWGFGERQPRYAVSAIVFLLPLVAVCLSSVAGRSRRAFEGIATVSILWMFFVFFSMGAVIFGDRVLFSRQFARHQYFEYPPAIDNLPLGSTIVNFSSRSSNFPLFGSSHQNRVVSYLKALQAFGIEPKSLNWNSTLEKDTKGIDLFAPSLNALGATHIYLVSKAKLFFDDCVTLREIDRLDRNPQNQVSFDSPKILYEIKYCAELAGKLVPR